MIAIKSDLRHALDPAIFASEALGLEPDSWQSDVLRWAGRRLLLNCGRQTGKSTVAASLSLHTALYRSGSLVLLVSPSLRQSGELFRKVSEQLGRLAERPTLTEDNKLSLTLANRSRVVSLPSSEGTIRGFSGASLIIEDEASRVGDDLYRAVRPMLATSNGRLILMSTPFGKRGHFFSEWQNGGDVWQRVMVKASECPRIIPEFLAEEKASMGDWWYQQEYCCEFLDAESAAFRQADIDAALSEVTTWNLL